MIGAVGVVVPVHDEAALLPRCLAALDRALVALPENLHHLAVVVLDACRDDSAAIAERWAGGDRAVITVDARNVGAARAAGMRRVLDALPRDRARIWLATTDADSEVPPGWLVEQLRFARDGAEAVAGSIQVTDWNGYPIGFGERFVQFYEAGGEHHGHVHGANLGVRADAYLEAGGFAPLATGEDHALWRALHARPRCVVARPRSDDERASRCAGPGGLQWLSERLRSLSVVCRLLRSSRRRAIRDLGAAIGPGPHSGRNRPSDSVATRQRSPHAPSRT